MADSNDAPILSRLAEDPAEGEAVDAFVVGLAERVDALQDCEVRGAMDALSESLASLSEAAVKAGFDSLARVADAAQQACGAGDADATRNGLIELTDTARRIRMGHRGAA
jgi:methylphosphotriester-DNA--protein-cysteine methyltransferase